jgi:hypothetical protein
MDGVFVDDLDGVDNADGDVERVEGALTAIESAVDAVVDKDVVDPVPVRSIEAASLGRPGPAGKPEPAVPELVLDEFELILIRAAS